MTNRESTGMVVEGESREVARLEPTNAVAMWGTDDPARIVTRAKLIAEELRTELTRARGADEVQLVSAISGRRYVRLEGWTLAGSLLGVFAVTDWTRKLADPEGWEARVEARTVGGAVVGAAEASCTRDEAMWGWHPTGRDGRPLDPRDDFALRSMAQTRAAAKALRMPLGFIMALGGFESTPADEMPEASSPRERAAAAGNGAKPAQEKPAQPAISEFWRRVHEELEVTPVVAASALGLNAPADVQAFVASEYEGNYDTALAAVRSALEGK